MLKFTIQRVLISHRNNALPVVHCPHCHVLNFTAFNLNLEIFRVYFVFVHIQHFALPFYAIDRYQMNISISFFVEHSPFWIALIALFRFVLFHFISFCIVLNGFLDHFFVSGFNVNIVTKCFLQHLDIPILYNNCFQLMFTILFSLFTFDLYFREFDRM